MIIKPHTILLLAIITTLIFSCKKTQEIPSSGNKINFRQTSIDSISYYKAYLSTTIVNSGGNKIINTGHCWSMYSTVSVRDNRTNNNYSGSNSDTIISETYSMLANRNYYHKFFIITENDTIYSKLDSLNTLDTRKPKVTLGEIFNISINMAQAFGYNDDGGLEIIKRGICFNKTGNPTILDPNSQESSGTGMFTGSFLGLDDNTIYYIRAFAENEKGISYSEEKSFTTLTLSTPVIESFEVSEITYNSASSGGKVLSTGNDDIISKGILWNTNNNPTLDNYIDRTIDHGHDSSFINQITNLQEFTTYYVRAYAVNSAGAGYGDVIEFTTLGQNQCGQTTVNYGGQIYHTVLIGEQCWLRENLNIGILIQVDQDMTDNQIIEKYCYDNDENNCDIYGGLYQWNEIMKYVTEEGVQGICPDGWHIPSNTEWCELTTFIDSTVDCELTSLIGTTIGYQIKSKIGWENNGNGNNEYDFNALPAGYRWEIGFGNLKRSTIFSTSSEFNSSTIWTWGLSYNNDKIGHYNVDSKSYGISVRCVQD